jgi:hypothetical protein
LSRVRAAARSTSRGFPCARFRARRASRAFAGAQRGQSGNGGRVLDRPKWSRDNPARVPARSRSSVSQWLTVASSRIWSADIFRGFEHARRCPRSNPRRVAGSQKRARTNPGEAACCLPATSRQRWRMRSRRISTNATARPFGTRRKRQQRGARSPSVLKPTIRRGTFQIGMCRREGGQRNRPPEARSLKPALLRRLRLRWRLHQSADVLHLVKGGADGAAALAHQEHAAPEERARA